MASKKNYDYYNRFVSPDSDNSNKGRNNDNYNAFVSSQDNSLDARIFRRRRQRLEEEKQKQLVEGYKERHRTTGRTTAQADLLRADRERASETAKLIKQSYKPSSSYLPGTKAWQASKRRENANNKIGYMDDGNMIRYEDIPSMPDFKETVQTAKDKAAEEREAAGILGVIGRNRANNPVEAYFNRQYSQEEYDKLFGDVKPILGEKARDTVFKYAEKWDGRGTPGSQERQYALMTLQERNVYDYILERKGREAADNYLNSLEASLNERGAAEQYQGSQENAGWYRVPLNILKSVTGGVENAVEGITSIPEWIWGNPVENPPSESELLQEKMVQGAGGAEALAYKAANAIGNMLPSIAFGGLTGSAGAASAAFAAQAGGQSYRQDIMEGRPVSGAQANALLTAADETVTNWLLGGIAQYGGGAIGKALKKSKAAQAARQGISNALAKKPALKRALLGAMGYGADMVSEGTQEAVQDITESVRKHFIYGDGLDIVGDLTDPQTWEDFALGALTAGIMNAPGTVYNGMQLNRYGSTLNPDYRDYAQGLDTNRESYANEADYQEAVDLQQLAEEYAARQRQGEFVSNADKARYDMRLREWMARRQEQAAAEQMAQAEARKQQEGEPRAEAQAQQQAREPKAEEPQEVPPREAEESQGPGEAPAPDAWTARAGEMPGMKTVEEAAETIKMGQEAPQNIRESAGAAQVEPVNLGRSQAEAYAKPYGKNGQEALMSNYDGSIDVNTYSRAFGRAYDAGYQNISMDTAQQSAVMAVLTEEQALAAYKAGAQDYNMDHNVRLPQMAQGAPKSGGLGEIAETATQAQRKVVEHIGKMTGLTINIVEGDGGNVRASYGRGQITLSADSDNMLGDLSHELTHFIREYSPSAYEAYTSIVSEAEMKATGRSWENLVEDYINDYADAGQELTRQQAIEELVSDAAEKFLNDEEFINSVVKKDRNLAQRIVDFLTDVIDAIKELIRKGSSTAAAQNLEEDLKLYEEARDTWMYGLDKAGEARTEGWEPAGQGKARTETQGEAQAEGQKGERKALAHPEQVTEQTIEENYQAVRDMDPVTDLTGEEFPRGEKKLSEMVLDFFDSIGNKAHNPVVGDVLLDSRAVKDDMNHGVNHTKAVAFAAIPDVISQGKVLDHQRNWKGRGYDSATLGAKIRIGGEDFYELVVVKLRDKNRLYVHAVYTARMGGPLSLNQVFPVATAGGTGTSGNGPAPSESKTAVAPAARRPAGSSTANLGSGSLPVSSIFERLLNVKGGEETRYKIAGKRIEETDNKDLVAIHNLSEEKLMESLELGGFPMPSIAVTRASEGHDNFGDISVVFRKDTIDPKINRANRVFSADAYTPRFPKTEYKLNETELSGLAARVGMSEASLESNVFDGGDKGQMIDKMKGRNEVREAFLKERGIPIEPVLQQPSISGRHASKGARDFLSREDIDFHSVVYDPSVREEYLDALFANSKWSEAAIKRRRDKVNEQLEGYKDNAAEYGRAEASFQQDQEIARGTAEPVKDASSHTEGVSNAIEAHASEFEEYARGLVEPILGEKYIRNNKDRFNSRGEQRSFNELHDEYTLDNIVRVMAENGMRNAESALTSGTGNVSAALSREFPDIEAIRKEKGRIRNLTEEEYKQVYGKADRLLDEVARYLAGVRGDTGYMALDRAIECLTEAFGSKKTEKGIRSFLEKEYGYTGIPDTTMKKIMDLREYMLAIPVRYFEAKPGRAVGLDEIAAVVLPLNASEGLKSSLAAEGVKTVLYDPALPNARREAVSGLEDVRFKLEGNEDTSETDLETLIRENEKLKEANEKLKNQFKLTPKDAVREADIARIARGILKEYNSQYSSKKLQEQMTRLYKYIRNSEDVDMNETARVAAEIGRGVLKQSSKLDTAFAAQYRDLRDQIRNTKIELSQADRQDLDAVGGYSAFRKKYFGRIRLGEGGISVDSLYQELNGQYPELFSADYTHPADQLMAIARVLDETREQVENEYHADMDEMSILIGQKILEEYANVRSTPPTFADRKQEQVEQARKKARAEYRAKMQEYVNGIRKEYTAQIGTARKELAQELDRIKKAREAAEEALAEAEKKGDKQEKQARLKEIRELREEYREINRQDRSAKYLLKPDMYVESMRKARESHQRSKDREAIYKEVKRLQGWLLRPTDTKHIPKEFRGMVAQFLSEIDYSSQFKTGKNKDEDTKRTIEWNQVKSQLDKIIEQEGVATGEDGSMVQMDIDPDLKKKIEELSQKADDIDKLNELDAYHMKELREVVTALGKAITEANDVKSNERYTKVSEMAEAVLKDIQPKKDRTEYTGTAGGVDKLLNYDMLDPLTMFRKLGPSAYTAWESLRDGLNKKTQKLKEAEDHISRLMEKNNISGKDIREWSGKRAKATTFKLPGGEIRLTTGQIMALYVENRREQAKKHIYSKEGGIKAGDRRVGVHLEKGRIVMVSLPHVEKGAAPIRVSEADVKAITDTLTPQQKALADGIQQFMGKEVASWGNEVSMAMYGYEKFTAREYFPIKTDDNYIPVKESEGGTRRQPTIKNLGMTKSTNEHANNPIIIEDIFDVYTRQVDQMSSYNAYVLPLSDLQKVLNYKDAEAAMSMRQEIGRAFGSAANRYLAKLIDDINGSVNSDKGLGEKLISNMKAASVAGNIRVIIQQPTAYIRALAEIDGKYLAKGAATMTRKDQWEMICKYAPIAQWKDWGFYRMDTSRQMKDILLETDSATQKFVNFTMKPAEMADKFAWNRIWRACEMECMDRHPDLQPGTEKFYQEVGKRFSEIIDKTQVVDSVLHRTQIMRSENGLTKMATSFMGEPLKTMDILYRATLDLRENVPGAKKKAGKAAGAVVSSALLTALVASLPDTLRDDDREKDFGEKYLENLRENMIDNLTLVNNIPWAKDILSIAQGNTPGRTDLGGFQDLYYAYQKIMKLKDGESQYTPQYVAAYTVQMTSKLTGIPVRSIVRDAGSIVDTIFNALGGEADYNWLKQVYSISSQENLSLYVQMMIEAQRQGNTKLAGEIKTDLNKAGIDNDKIGSKIRSVVKKELVSDEAVDPRIDAAAHAKQEMEIDEYRRNVMELAGEGYAQDIIESAIKTRINQLNGDEEADPEEEMKVPYEDLFADVLGGEIEEDAVSIYGSSDVAAAVDKFDGTPKSLEDFNVMAEDILTGKVRDGKKKTEAIGEIKSSITRKYKQAWIDAYNRKDKETYEGIQNKLKQLKVGGKYLYGGDDWISWKDAAKKSQEEKEK